MTTSLLESPRTNEQHEEHYEFAEHEAHPSFGTTEEGLEVPFAKEEIESFQQDDSMASGMISTILACSFLVMIVLTTCVGLWTISVTHAAG